MRLVSTGQDGALARLRLTAG